MSSILSDTKGILGLQEDYIAFDLDVTTHINSAFTVLSQLGVGPADGFFISDSAAQWEEFDVPENQRNLAKTYIYLKVKFLFDPPPTSFAVEAMENQIKEFEWRLNMFREEALPDPEEVTP